MYEVMIKNRETGEVRQTRIDCTFDDREEARWKSGMLSHDRHRADIFSGCESPLEVKRQFEVVAVKLPDGTTIPFHES